MKFIRGIKNLKGFSQGTVLTIGNFDGIHLGHQSLVSKLKQKSKELRIPSCVLFFEPQPKEFFNVQNKPPRLSSISQKYEFFNKIGIDYLVCLRFSSSIAAMTPEEFIQKILVELFNVQHLIVGDDFRFGAKREGNFEYLINYINRTHNFTAEQSESFTVDGVRVSSTAVRNALAEDNLDLATKYLGRLYTISGKVTAGRQIGRTIGFPTANIKFGRFIAPVNGVYAVNVIIDNKSYHGIANIGNNPTVNGKTPKLETFIFDFNQNIYGKRIIVELISKIRSEIHFSGLNELKHQINEDRIIAENIFKNKNK